MSNRASDNVIFFCFKTNKKLEQELEGHVPKGERENDNKESKKQCTNRLKRKRVKTNREDFVDNCFSDDVDITFK